MDRELSRLAGTLRAWASIALLPVVLSLLAFSLPGESSPNAERPAADVEPLLSNLETRAAVVGTGLDRVDAFLEDEVAPVEAILRPFHDDQDYVRRISLALVAEGRNAGMDPRALASLLLVENPWLDPEIESSVGAVGLMQVMPVHAGEWGCASDDLTDVETNICHGARIFASYLDRYENVDRALLAYNGCVNGTNTPNCHLYPSHVYSQAGKAAMHRWVRAEE